MDRASDYGSEGWKFESSRARQTRLTLVGLGFVERVLFRMRSRRFNRRVSCFDTTPYLREQKTAFSACGLDFESAQQAVAKFFRHRGQTRTDTSQHWEVAAGVVLTGQVQRILEIGTERGEFTAFLHSLSHDLEITTVDLPGDDERYINATTQTSSDLMSTDEAVASTINQRRKNIGDLKNVRFWEMSSVRLSLLDDQFDLIYVDGDHTFPIVAIDAINAFRLVAPDGWILFDDLISDRRAKSEYGGSESTQIVNVMEKSGILTATRFHKRLEAAKLIDETDRKHIALAKPRKRVV